MDKIWNCIHLQIPGGGRRHRHRISVQLDFYSKVATIGTYANKHNTFYNKSGTPYCNATGSNASSSTTSWHWFQQLNLFEFTTLVTYSIHLGDKTETDTSDDSQSQTTRSIRGLHFRYFRHLLPVPPQTIIWDQGQKWTTRISTQVCHNSGEINSGKDALKAEQRLENQSPRSERCH